MRRPLALLCALAGLALPATAQAADTPLTGLTADSGGLLSTGTTVASANGATVSRLDGGAFVAAPSAAGRVLDLGTDRGGAAVLVRAGCGGGVALCTTPLTAATPVGRIAAIDPRHCLTTGAAIDRGRIALAVVARKGRAGQRCAAGVYERAAGSAQAKRRYAVKRWRIGNPVELYGVDVSIDLRGATALVRIHQSSFEVGDAPDDSTRLISVALASGRARTVATAVNAGDGGGLELRDAALGPEGIVAVGRCVDGGDEPTTEVLRWPAAGGAVQALTAAPFTTIAAATAADQGLVLRAADGSATLRDAPVFGPRPAPPSANCGL